MLAYLTNRERRVFEYLERNKTLTSKQAFNKFGISCLPGVVFALRKKGVDIRTELVTVANRYGEKCTVAEYSLKSP